MKSTSKPSKS